MPNLWSLKKLSSWAARDHSTGVPRAAVMQLLSQFLSNSPVFAYDIHHLFSQSNAINKNWILLTNVKAALATMNRWRFTSTTIHPSGERIRQRWLPGGRY
jgi:hypothetical protein